MGDVIDIWQMKKRIYWPQAHNDVIRTILGRAKRGTRTVYVPGAHNELLRDYHGTTLGNLELLHWTERQKSLKAFHLAA